MAYSIKKNYAKGELASGILIDATSFTLASGQGALFPDTGVGNYFWGVFWDTSKLSPFKDVNREIVKCYRASNDTFTITDRAQEGTSAKAWNSGDNFMLTLTSATINELENSIDAKVPTSTTVNTLALSGNIVIKPSNIPMETLVGTPTYSTTNDFINSFGSVGRKTGGVASDATGSKVAVTGGTGFIKATDDDNAQLIPFDWVAPSDITIPADSARYIGVEYNAGTPQVVARTTATWDYDTEFPLARVVNDTINGAEELYVVNTPWWVTDGMTNVIQALRSFGLVRRDEYVGGLMLSGTGTRNIAVSAGTIWAALNDIAFTGIDTAVTGTVQGYWYKAGSGWQRSDLTQYSVTQYNDVTQTTLQNLSANKYANVWIYGEMTDSTISIALLYPQAQYNTAAEAESKSAPDNVPVHISQLGMLLGRFIIKQNVDAPVSTQSVFTTKFSTSVVTSHPNLGTLGWTSCGHTGTASTIAGFAAATGAAAEYTLSGTGTALPTTTAPTFVTSITTPSVLATANDSGALGASGTAFSDLFLASGGVINWNAGNATLTHSTGLLTSNVPLSLGTSNSLTCGSIELGAASDTTITRTGAGAIAVEGVAIPTISSTSTLTNKSIGGALTLEENASIAHDPALSADGKYTGLTITGTAGATVAFGDLITLDKDDSRWELVDISAAAAATGDGRGILGMAVSAGNDGDTITILLNGVIRADANFPTLTIGAGVYASTTGDVVVAQPSTADYVIRIIGFGLTADSMYFNPENDWITHT